MLSEVYGSQVHLLQAIPLPSSVSITAQPCWDGNTLVLCTTDGTSNRRCHFPFNPNTGRFEVESYEEAVIEATATPSPAVGILPLTLGSAIPSSASGTKQQTAYVVALKDGSLLVEPTHANASAAAALKEGEHVVNACMLPATTGESCLSVLLVTNHGRLLVHPLSLQSGAEYDEAECALAVTKESGLGFTSEVTANVSGLGSSEFARDGVTISRWTKSSSQEGSEAETVSSQDMSWRVEFPFTSAMNLQVEVQFHASLSEPALLRKIRCAADVHHDQAVVEGSAMELTGTGHIVAKVQRPLDSSWCLNQYDWLPQTLEAWVRPMVDWGNVSNNFALEPTDEVLFLSVEGRTAGQQLVVRFACSVEFELSSLDLVQWEGLDTDDEEAKQEWATVNSRSPLDRSMKVKRTGNVHVLEFPAEKSPPLPGRYALYYIKDGQKGQVRH